MEGWEGNAERMTNICWTVVANRLKRRRDRNRVQKSTDCGGSRRRGMRKRLLDGGLKIRDI